MIDCKTPSGGEAGKAEGIPRNSYICPCSHRRKLKWAPKEHIKLSSFLCTCPIGKIVVLIFVIIDKSRKYTVVNEISKQ